MRAADTIGLNDTKVRVEISELVKSRNIDAAIVLFDNFLIYRITKSSACASLCFSLRDLQAQMTIARDW